MICIFTAIAASMYGNIVLDGLSLSTARRAHAILKTYGLNGYIHGSRTYCIEVPSLDAERARRFISTNANLGNILRRRQSTIAIEVRVNNVAETKGHLFYDVNKKSGSARSDPKEVKLLPKSWRTP